MIVKKIRDEIYKKNRGKVFNDVEQYSSDDFTACPRKVYLRNKTRKVDVEYLFYENLINSNEESEFNNNSKNWYNILSEFKGINVSKKDLVFSDINHDIYGKLNLVIKFENELYGVNIHRLMQEEFRKINTIQKPYKKHVINNMMNLWLSEIPNGLVIYFCGNNFEIFEVSPINSIISSVVNSIDKIRNATSVPEKPYKDSKNKECESCYFINRCWEKERI